MKSDTRKVPFLDLRVIDENEKSKLMEAVERVFDHGRMVLGPEVSELEKKIAERCGRKYGIGVNSGSTALHLALRALDIGPGDQVITTSLSWVATANAISMTGAEPVFVDIKDDLNMNVDLIDSYVTPQTKAIMPVHWTGRMCDMSKIMDVAEKHGLFVIEDAAQAFDATFEGRKAGYFGDMACFSMNAMKVFASCGDSGVVVTDDSSLYEKLNSLRYAGTLNREECIHIALNGRMDTLEAAILLVRLDTLDDVISKRREIASWYKEGLKGIVGLPESQLMKEDVWYTYTIKADDRDELRKHLDRRGIETKIHHPILLPDQPVYKTTYLREGYPVGRELVKKIVSLPANEKINRSDVDYVVESIIDFYAG